MTTKLWGTTVPGNKEESRDAVVLRNKKKVNRKFECGKCEENDFKIMCLCTQKGDDIRLI